MSKKINIDIYENSAKVYILSDKIFKKISDTETPQGALVVCKKLKYNIEEILNKNNPFILLLEEISNPGNLGTVIRTADSAGVDAIILSKNCVDIYNKKVLRSTAGSIFNVPIIQNQDLIEIVKFFNEKGIKTIAGHLKGNNNLYKLDLTNGCVIAIGNEAKGLSDELSSIILYKVKIPIIGKAESLNASVATAILLYEVVRQNLEK